VLNLKMKCWIFFIELYRFNWLSLSIIWIYMTTIDKSWNLSLILNGFVKFTVLVLYCSTISSSSSSSSSCLYHINSPILPSSALNSAYISVIMAIYELLSPSFSDPWTTLALSISLAQYHVTAPGLSSPSHKMSSLHIYHIGWCIDADEWIMMVMNTRTINQSINQMIIIISLS